MEFQKRPRVHADLAVLLLASRFAGAQHLSATSHALMTVNELIRNQYLLTCRRTESRPDGKWRPCESRFNAPRKLWFIEPMREAAIMTRHSDRELRRTSEK